jgi:hypothetical protein
MTRETERGTLPPVLDYEALEARVPDLRAQYAKAEPYPHAIMDDFLDPECARRAWAAFPAPHSGVWTAYKHVNEDKVGRSDRALIPPDLLRIIDELNSPRFIALLSEITGIPDLLADPTLEGGGLHQSGRGGFLNMHADFTGHPHRPGWARRVNVLVYLNPGWRDEYGGHLELWDRAMRRCVRRVAPVLNRCLIFSTDRESFHGHPEPMTCPPGTTRKSVALYYFTEDAALRARSTEYRPRPTDRRARRALIRLDTLALRGYDFAKRRLGFGDGAVSALLRLAFGRRGRRGTGRPSRR